MEKLTPVFVDKNTFHSVRARTAVDKAVSVSLERTGQDMFKYVCADSAGKEEIKTVELLVGDVFRFTHKFDIERE